jgi:hypothetical protein
MLHTWPALDPGLRRHFQAHQPHMRHHLHHASLSAHIPEALREKANWPDLPGRTSHDQPERAIVSYHATALVGSRRRGGKGNRLRCRKSPQWCWYFPSIWGSQSQMGMGTGVAISARIKTSFVSSPAMQPPQCQCGCLPAPSEDHIGNDMQPLCPPAAGGQDVQARVGAGVPPGTMPLS